LAWILAGAVLLIGTLVALPVNGRTFGESIAGLILVGVGVMIAEVARSGVLVGQDGITVRTLLRSRYLTWFKIDLFEVKTPFLRGALRIYLTDGTMISTTGLDGRSARERRLSKAWIAELNKRAGQVTYSHGSSR
jgi:hypothetical protein